MGDRALVGQRLSALREFADILRVVEGLDMLARPGDRHGVEQLEEIEVESLEDGGGGPLLWRKLRPGIERLLGAPEYLLDPWS